MKDCTIPKTELYSPPTYDIMSRVIIVPLKFLYEFEGSTKSWSEFGNWIHILNDGGYDLPITERSTVDKLIVNITDENDIVRTLYHYMQDNTRYVNVAIDKGGLKPYSADYVSNNKYGDCKALTYYMKSLLRYVGIESYYTLVSSGDNSKIIKIDEPGQQFDHVILCVPMDDDTVWLENTSNYLPYGYLGTFTQNRDVLLINGRDSKLVRTPKMEFDDVRDIEYHSIELNDAGVGLATVNLILRGSRFETANYYFKEASEEMKAEMVEDLINMQDFELLEWEYDQNNRDSKNLAITAQLELINQFRDIGSMKILKPIVYCPPDFEKPSIRKLPVRINYPITSNSTALYKIKSIIDYRIEVPDNVVIESEFGSYYEDYSVVNNTIRVVSKYQLNAGEIPIHNYKSYYDFNDNILKAQKKSNIILKTQ